MSPLSHRAGWLFSSVATTIPGSREGGGSKPHLTDRNIEAQRGPQKTPAAPFYDTPEAVWEWHELGTEYPEEMSELGLQVGGEGIALQTASGRLLLAFSS